VSLKVVVATRRRDNARERLFNAGWKPYMASLPDDKYHDLLIALNNANAELTRAILQEQR
jgi:hypothetical protein